MSEKAAMFDELGRILAELRKEAGLTQQELADRSGISAAMISGYEQGKNDPKLATLGKLLNGLGVGIEELGRRLREVRGPRRLETQRAQGHLPATTAVKVSEILEHLGAMMRLAIRQPEPRKPRKAPAQAPPEEAPGGGDR